MQTPVPRSLAFDDVLIDFAGQRLSRGGVEQPLEPKAFAVLALLASRPGEVCSRDDLLDAVWGHRHVTQGVLNRIMSLLRQALGEDAQHPRRLHTVHGVGYRFDLPAAMPADTIGPPEPRQARRARAVYLVACLLLAACAAGAWWWQRNVADSQRMAAADPPPASTAAAATPPPSLAVLPFADLSQAHDQRYLADGLAEEILDQLAQSPALRVVGRSSSFSFPPGQQEPRAAARRLGVAYLLQGSVRRQGQHLRISTQLLRGSDGTQLWSKVYARDLRDVFALQDEIARDVALALSVRLDVARFNREQGGSTLVDAYERYLRWRDIGMREQFDVAHDRQRLQLAREMVALDPACVLCRDALATSLNAMAQELGGRQAGQLRAEAAQVRDDIARIAPDSWIARRDHSNALWRQGRRAEAMALAKQVMASGPLNKERAWDYAYMIYAMGHLDETIALVEQVRAVEPMALFLSRDLQYDYTAARRYPDAEAEYQRGRSLEGSQQEPDYVAFFRQLAGQRPHGSESLRDLHARLLQHGGDLDSPFFRELGTHLDDRAAMLSGVRRALADPAYAGGRTHGHVATSVADALGDADLAAIALRQELEAQPGWRDGRMAQQGYVAFWNAPYSRLRSHPEFKRLLIQAGVVDTWRQTGHWGDGCAPLGEQDFECR